VTRALWLVLAVAGCYHGFDPNPRTTKDLRLLETRIDRNKGELRHVHYAIRKFGENIVFAVRGDVTRTFGFTGQRTTALDTITYNLADRDGVDMVLTCTVATIAIHPRAATYASRADDDQRCDGQLAWNMPASISMRVLVCDQKDATAKATPGMFWHAGAIRLAPGPGVEEVVEQCPGDDAAIYSVGFRSETQ
jgi:hypothetical protein